METIKFLRSPYLVQNAIADNKDLHEIFALSTISLRSRRIAKQCLSRQPVYMRYVVDNYLLSQRGPYKEFNFQTPSLLLITRSKKDQHLVYPYQYWKLLNQDSVTVKVFNAEKSKQTTLQIYWENKEDSAEKILQYVVELFPRHSFDLYFKPNHTVEVLQTNMKFMEHVNSLNSVGVTNSAPNPPEFPLNDKFHEAVSNITRRPRVLYSDMTTTDGYLYDLPANCSFNCDIVFIKDAKWISAESFIKLFSECRNVEFAMIYFSDNDLAAILEKWSQSSSIQRLILHCRFYSNFEKKFTDVVGNLPEAIPVRNAAIYARIVPGLEMNQLKPVIFNDGRCYKIKGPDGKSYLIFYIWHSLYLTPHFEEITNDVVLPNVDSCVDWRE